MAATESLMPSSEDGKTKDNVEMGQVKFTKGSDNVDVTASNKLIGLTKEQLEQYRNDPFWKPIRYALFILFWLVWLLMFVGAILIVVMSPKCAAKEVTKWSKVAVAYQVFTPTFYDSDKDGVGDFEGIRQKLDYFRKIGATTVWARHVIQANKDDWDPALVTDFDNIDNRLGNEAHFKKLVEGVHDKDLYFVMDIPLTVAKKHGWATKNLAKNYTSDDIYVVNLDDETVSGKILDTIKKFLSYGVDGFYFSEYRGSKDGFNKNNLESFIQRIKREVIEKDEDLKEKEILFFADSKLRKDTPNSNIEFFVQPLLNCDEKDVYNCVEKTISDSKNLANNNSDNKAQPLWEITDLYGGRIDSKLADYTTDEKSKLASLTSLVQLFLRGPSSILYGEELAIPSFNGTKRGIMRWTTEGQNHGFSEASGKLFFQTNDVAGADVQTQSGDVKSPFETFKRMAKLRQRDEVLQVGKLEVKTIGEKSFLLSRFQESSPLEKVYILAANFDKSEIKRISKTEINDADLIQGRSLNKAEILVVSAYNDRYHVRQILNLNELDGFELDPLHGIVFSLHP